MRDRLQRFWRWLRQPLPANTWEMVLVVAVRMGLAAVGLAFGLGLCGLVTAVLMTPIRPTFLSALILMFMAGAVITFFVFLVTQRDRVMNAIHRLTNRIRGI